MIAAHQRRGRDAFFRGGRSVVADLEAVVPLAIRPWRLKTAFLGFDVVSKNRPVTTLRLVFFRCRWRPARRWTICRSSSDPGAADRVLVHDLDSHSCAMSKSGFVEASGQNDAVVRQEPGPQWEHWLGRREPMPRRWHGSMKFARLSGGSPHNCRRRTLCSEPADRQTIRRTDAASGRFRLVRDAAAFTSTSPVLTSC